MNIEVIDYISEAGTSTKPNEDLLIIEHNLAVVLDGATGLGRKLLDTSDSDAEWFVSHFGEALKKHWVNSQDFVLSLQSALHESYTFFKFRIKSSSLCDFEYPSSGLVAICVEDEKTNLYRLGDCSAFKLSNNIKPLFCKSELEYLDDISILKMGTFLNAGLSQKEARNKLLPTLREHRSLINKSDGYSALSLAHDSISKIEKLELTPSEVGNKILLTSDGFSALFQLYMPTNGEIINNDFTLYKALRKIREIENNDLDLDKYPRLKAHDDSSAVLVTIKK